MTAASPACSPASSRSSPACLQACHTHLKKGEALRSKLHLSSGPGVWLLFGVVVVVVGMSVAVAGYVSAAAHKPLGGRMSPHIERMKLAGPVVMGIGLFIFICAATLLYENRDREVRRRETDDDLEDLKGGSCWEDSQEQPSYICQEQWEGKDGELGSWSTPTHVLPLSDPPPSNTDHCNVTRGPSPPPVHGEDEEMSRKQEDGEGKPTLLAQVLHHQEPNPHPPSPCLSISLSSVYSDSCNSSQINFNVRTESSAPPPP
ncbi:uncharacterized protein tmem200b [Gouania willdenowi]|uniref:Transmembrane protein 200B n=1 Tax=Gouania willdenowi TaxID=441366 RepID=A0A8C5HZM8_GOUWI|nr:transmembrane protein 200B [Gouania willdenowi]